MTAFDWARITRAEEALGDILCDLADAIEAQPDSVDPAVVALVRGEPLGPDILDHMGDRSTLIFNAYLRFDQAHSRLLRARAAAETLAAMDERESRGLYAPPGAQA